MAQFNKKTLDYLNQERSLHEVMMMSDRYGNIATPPVVNSHNTLQVSNRSYYFSSTFQYSIRPDLWDTRVTGSGSVAHNSTYQIVDLSVSGNGDSVLRRTTKLIPYFPGRTLQMSFAGKFAPDVKDTVTQRVGLYDDNNGMMFQLDAGGLKCVIRKNGDDTRYVYQENWNVDKLDGTGPSKLTIDPSKFQVGIIEFEWYGGGRVKFGVIIEDEIRWVHYFDNGNYQDFPYMGTSVLPISYEIISTGGAATVCQGSSVASLLGDIPKAGQPRFYGNPITTPITLGTAGVYYRCISVRLNPAYIDSIVIFNKGRGFGESNTAYRYRVSVQDTFRNNGDTADSDPSTWTWVNVPGSVLQYSIPTAASPERVVTTSGIAFEGDYFVGNATPSADGGLDDFIGQMGRKIDKTSDIWTLSVTCPSPSKTAYGALYWTELIK